MTRLPTLFATAAASALALGLLTCFVDVHSGMSLVSRGTGYMLPNRTLCYGVTLLFCFFAFLYSIWIVPWSIHAGRWHFGLSIFCVACLCAAWAGTTGLAAGKPTALALPAMIVFAAAPILFLLVQALYLIDGLRRCLLLFTRS